MTMILKGSQRGGAKQLANHLLKVVENEHVEVYEVRGFMSDDLHGALKEIYAVSQGTRCKQFMFSVSLNPPQNESAPVEYFEKALADIEKDLGLENQPRAVVFHEKEGRRHAHCVWSRINTEEMKAINLPYYKLKLRDISKQLYFQHGWKMPRGLLDSAFRTRTNFTLAEWQQAKRLNEDPKTLKKLFQECWAVSDSRKAFSQVLEENGLYLAKGDRRGYVAVDYRGEVFSLSKWAGVKTKQLKSRLGDPKSLPSIDDVKVQISNKMTEVLESYIKEVQKKIENQKEPLLQKKQSLRKHHHEHRVALKEKQEERWQKETVERSQRLPKGLKGIWNRITGKYQKIRKKNERETEKCRVRDRDEKQALIDRQLKERQVLQKEIQHIRNDRNLEILNLRQDIARYIEMSGKSQKSIHEKLDQVEKQQKRTRAKDKDQGYEPEI
jgi:hypothetical protein